MFNERFLINTRTQHPAEERRKMRMLDAYRRIRLAEFHRSEQLATTRIVMRQQIILPEQSTDGCLLWHSELLTRVEDRLVLCFRRRQYCLHSRVANRKHRII